MVKKRLFFSSSPKKSPWYKKPKPKTKPKSMWGRKPEKKDKYHTKYNIYFYDVNGRPRKVATRGDKEEAESWVANKRAMSPNADYKIVPDVKKKGW